MIAGMAKPISASLPTKTCLLTLFPQLGLSLFHRSNNHVTHTSIWKPVQVCTETIGLDQEKRLCARIVAAVDDGTNGQTEGQTEFGSRGGGFKT